MVMNTERQLDFQWIPYYFDECRPVKLSIISEQTCQGHHAAQFWLNLLAYRWTGYSSSDLILITCLNFGIVASPE